MRWVDLGWERWCDAGSGGAGTVTLPPTSSASSTRKRAAHRTVIYAPSSSLWLLAGQRWPFARMVCRGSRDRTSVTTVVPRRCGGCVVH